MKGPLVTIGLSDRSWEDAGKALVAVVETAANETSQPWPKIIRVGNIGLHVSTYVHPGRRGTPGPPKETHCRSTRRPSRRRLRAQLMAAPPPDLWRRQGDRVSSSGITGRFPDEPADCFCGRWTHNFENAGHSIRFIVEMVREVLRVAQPEETQS